MTGMLDARTVTRAMRHAADGDAWYGTATLKLGEGVSAAEAASHETASTHSIWEILLHMTGWIAEVDRRLVGAAPAPPADGDWPAVADTSEAAWDAAKRAFVDANERLIASVRSLPADRWTERCGAERSPELGTGGTLAETVLGLVQHNAYHSGQIALLVRIARAQSEK